MAGSSSASVIFSAATDSPVSAASSTVRLIDWSRRASAGTRSPVRMMTTSPGTSSRAGHDHFLVIAHDTRGRCGHLPQGFERAAGAVLLDEAEQHGEQHDDRDDGGFERVAEETGEDRGAQQDQDQDVLELGGERVPRGDGRSLLRVRSARVRPGAGRLPARPAPSASSAPPRAPPRSRPCATHAVAGPGVSLPVPCPSSSSRAEDIAK